MSEKNKKFLESYARHFLVAALAVWTAKGLSIDNLADVETLKAIVNAGLAAVVGPLVKALVAKNKEEEAVVAPVKKAATRKRTPVK